MIAGDLKPKTAKQWLKLALIPVLGAVLLLVLWQNPKPKSESDQAAVQPAPLASPLEAASSAHAANPPVPVRPVWRRARVEDVIAFNPFEPELPEESDDFDDAADDRSEASGGANNRKTDKSRGRSASAGQLQAIFVDAQGAAAILDSQVVRVGDDLPTGGRVVEISADGVKLEGL